MRGLVVAGVFCVGLLSHGSQEPIGVEPGSIVCEGIHPRHLQGVDTDGSSIWWSFTKELVRTDLSGRILLRAPVPKHHGDICVRNGVLYCAVNLAKFNEEAGRADSHVMSYDAATLRPLGRWSVPEVVHGAGGMTEANGHFYVIGGAPSTHEVNYVYEYDADFHFIRRHVLETGSTFMGIQTASFDRGRFLFGVYGWKGNPPGLLVCDPELKGFRRSTVNGSVGILRLNGRLYVAQTNCDDFGNNARGALVPAQEPDESTDYRPARRGGKVVVAANLRERISGRPLADVGFRRGVNSYVPLYVEERAFCPVALYPTNSPVAAFVIGCEGAPSARELARGVRRAAAENEVMTIAVADSAAARESLEAVRREASALGVPVETVSDSVAVEPAATHWPKQMMGRDFWTILSSNRYSDPSRTNELTGVWASEELVNAPVFRDCALVHHLGVGAPDPKTGLATWRTVRENASPDSWAALEANAKPDRPCAVVFEDKRGFHSPVTLGGTIDLDHADYAAWKSRHPNLVAVRMLCEWGNDIVLSKNRAEKIVDEKRRAEVKAFFAGFDYANRTDRVALARKYVDRMLALNYGDLSLFSAFRASYQIDHLAAQFGARSLTVEMTSTTGPVDAEYRWNTAAMFCRGAARQFDLPWCWYSAIYSNAFSKDGTWLSNSTCKYLGCAGNGRPEGGVSASLENRAWYWGYLNGANAVEPEGWFNHFIVTNATSGRATFSDRGRRFASFHGFTRRHPDRGAVYAPVALVIPANQGYRSAGGAAWGKCPMTEGDCAVDGLFKTIVPPRARLEALKRGEEGGILPSPYPMAFDVIVPDTFGVRKTFASALAAYPVAVVAGDFPDGDSLEAILGSWKKSGGRLVRLAKRDLAALPETLHGLVSELYPVSVAGDVVWGLNRTTRGWWIWCFNNRGIVKFADQFAKVLPGEARTVAVDLKGLKVKSVRELVTETPVEAKQGHFTFTIAPGEPAVFEVLGF